MPREGASVSGWAMSLTGKQLRHLRGLGHHLQPVVHVGQKGLHESVIAKVDAELESHELIKLKVGQGALDTAAEVAAGLATSCSAEVVQVLGGTVLLYKRHPEEPVIQLPG